MSQATWGLVFIALAVTAHALNKFRKLAPVAIMVGIAMVGTSGRVLALAGRALGFAVSVLGGLASQVLGYTVASLFAVAVCVLLFVLVHDLMPKHAAKRRTFYIAAVMGLLVAGAATPFAALNQFPATVQQGVAHTVQGG